MAGDRAFEQQFQWEVDRWVFRRRHRGDPVEVTPEERDRLISLHRSRLATGTRLICGLPLASPLVLGWSHLYYAPLIFFASMLVGMPVLMHWSDANVVKQMNGRPLLGMRLGAAGRTARRTQALNWPDLIISLALIGVIALFCAWLFTTPDYAGQPLMALWTFGLLGASGAFLIAMTVIKWAQHERARLHDEALEAIHRARRLGGD